MKKLIVLLMLLGFACTANAGRLEMDTYALFPVDSDLQQGYGLQGEYIFDTGFYPYLSYSLNPTEYLGSDMGLVNLASFGVGWTKTWNKKKHGFTIAMDGGWYSPHDSDLERMEYSTRTVYIKGKKRCKYTPTTVTEASTIKIEYEGDLGCKGLIGYSYSMTDILSSTLSVGGRYLELDERVNGVSGRQNFTAGIIMLSFRLRF